jgi:hypothetical protein
LKNDDDDDDDDDEWCVSQGASAGGRAECAPSCRIERGKSSAHCHRETDSTWPTNSTPQTGQCYQ